MKKNVKAIMSKEQAIKAISAFEKAKNVKLTENQKNIVINILSLNKNIVENDAGTGKSITISVVNFALNYNKEVN